MIVVDTNIITYRLIIGDKTDKTIELEKLDSDWIAPVLWRFEFLNVLSTLTKNNYLEIDQNILIWKNAESLLQNKEYSVDPEAVLKISVENKISAYDAQYIVLAKMYKTKCITEDKKLLTLFPGITLSLSNIREIGK